MYPLSALSVSYTHLDVYKRQLSDGKMAFVNCAYGDEPALERQKQGESVRWSLDARQKLTIRLSKDDGVTWNDGLMIAEEAVSYTHLDVYKRQTADVDS